MDQVFPKPVENVDPVTLVAGNDRSAPPDRPWVLCNMISSIDGAVAVDELSGGLGGPGDKAVFSALRAIPDVILAGSGTVIAENYRRPQTPPAIQAQRVERGQAPLPRIAIVTNSLAISAEHRVFDPDAPPIIITHANSPANRRAALAPVADIIDAGSNSVELLAALQALHRQGVRTVLLEGGPSLNGAFVAADLIDEFFLSFSPMLVGGNGPRAAMSSHIGAPRQMRLDRTLYHDGFLFHRYLRDR